MTDAETVATRLYPLYCDYVAHINRSAGLRGERRVALSILPQSDFVAIWNTLPESHRAVWERKFEAGHEKMANLEHRKLVAAFTSNELIHTEFIVVRAA